MIEAVRAPEPGRKRGRRRRRRGRRAEREGPSAFSALLPHLLTTGNLAAGFYAIVKASTGDPLFASYLIFVAGLFDIADGRAARLAGTESKFGQEYDSISDTVSFGVAPAVIAFHAGGFMDLQWAGWLLAFVYTACASLRLARFNVSSGRYKGRFDGLPSPAAAGMVVSSVWFTGFLRGHGIELDLPPLLPAIGVAVVGVAMVTPIPYHNFKGFSLGGSYGVIAFVIVLSIFLALEPGLNFFLIGLAYCLSGPFEVFWRRRTGRSLEELVVAASEAAQGVGLPVPSASADRPEADSRDPRDPPRDGGSDER